MEDQNKKAKRTYNDSLSQYFMTTKNIADIWNREVKGEDGKPRLLIQRKAKKNQNNPWKADDISKLFKSILKEWKLDEYDGWYRSDKLFHLKRNKKKLNDILELIQADIEMLVSKDVISRYKELQENIEQAVRSLEMVTKDSTPPGEYIFNIDVFNVDNINYEKYFDPLYFIYCLYSKKVDCTMEEIDYAVEMLTDLIPTYKSVPLQRSFNTYIAKQEIDPGERNDIIIKDYMSIQEKRRLIKIRLYQYFYNETDRWRVSNRWMIQERAESQEKKELIEIYRISFIIIDYIIEKYIFLINSIQLVREIDKELKDTEELSEIPIYQITSFYLKYFQYKLEADTQEYIKSVNNKETMNEAMAFLQNKLNTCIRGIVHTGKEEWSELYVDFVEEEDGLLREVPAYHKLYYGEKKWKKEDIDRYFELTRKKEEPYRVVKVEHKEYGLRILDDNNLQEVLKNCERIILSK